ncbi:MAG: hypothetical protein GY842_12895 [bacterium]|nr:hypothetical protein [bacterium]
MRTGRYTIVLVDLAGVVVSCALLGASAWQVFLKPSTASAEVDSLQSVLSERTRDATLLEHELGKQQRMLEERESRLAVGGAPPERTPIEEDLRTIADVVRRNRLGLTDVAPVGSVDYPGVREVRYRIIGEGRFADVDRTLREFEKCDFWGDITHVRLSGTKAGRDPEGAVCEMVLTVSFYSAISTPSPATGGE